MLHKVVHTEKIESIAPYLPQARVEGLETSLIDSTMIDARMFPLVAGKGDRIHHQNIFLL
jgi:hypothetical protein